MNNQQGLAKCVKKMSDCNNYYTYSNGGAGVCSALNNTKFEGDCPFYCKCSDTKREDVKYHSNRNLRKFYGEDEDLI